MALSVERQLADALRIQDPEERACRLQFQVLPELAKLHDSVLDARAVAVLEWNEAGVGGKPIAKRLGLALARSWQLIEEGRRVRAGEPRYKPKAKPVNTP